MRRLCREWNRSRSAQSLSESGEHHKVGVKLDALQATDAKRGEAVVVLQASELALDGSAASVEVFPANAAHGHERRRERIARKLHQKERPRRSGAFSRYPAPCGERG
jgi:hypothetical protein